MGSIIEAADELMQILEASLTDVTQLGAMAGDELLLTTGLHRLQACLTRTDSHLRLATDTR